MKKKSKILALVMSASMSASVLAGCSSNAFSVYSAMKKNTSITSAEVQTDVTLKLSAKNLSPQEQKDMGEVMKLNDSQIHVTSKFNQNSVKTTLKSQTDLKAKVGKEDFQTSIWTNNDATKQTTTVKVPKLISDKVLQLKGKDYLVIDNSQNAVAGTVDYSKIAQLEPKLTAFIDEYMKNFNPTKDPITSLGNKTIVQNGKKINVKVYQFALNDSSLKSLLHYAVNNISENKDSLSLLKDYLTSVISAVAPSKDEAAMVNSQIESAFANLDYSLPAITQQLNTYLGVFDKIKVLGDKGIVINFAVDSNGYVVNEQGDAQIVIDTASISKAIGDTTNKSKAIYTATIHFNNDIKNINGKVEISYPKTTKNNSVAMKMDDLLNLGDVYNAHDTVDAAINSNKIDTINDAKKMVAALPNSVDKTTMLSQLNDAANKLTLNQAKDLVKKAKSTLLVSDYEDAINVINQLPTSMSKSLLAELKGISKDVYTTDVNNALTTIKNLQNDKKKDLRKFDSAKQYIIKNVKKSANRDALLNKLSSTTGKDVYTSDVNSALKAIDTAKKKYTDANVKAAKAAIAKVKNKESAKYLQQLLTDAKPNTKK